jgi:hypothetical protein
MIIEFSTRLYYYHIWEEIRHEYKLLGNNECVVVVMKVLEMRLSATTHFHECDDIQGCKELIIKLFVQILGTWQFNNANFKCVFLKISFNISTLNLTFMGVCNI